MDLLKKELERKKKAVKEARGGRRFVKTQELRKVQHEIEEEQEAAPPPNHIQPSDRNKRQKTSHKQESVVSRAKSTLELPKDGTNNGNNNDNNNNSSSSSSKREELTETEIVAFLRSMGLAVKLFGENSAERTERIQQAQQSRKQQTLESKEFDEFKLEKAHMLRNPFLEKETASKQTHAVELAATAPSKPNESNQSDKQQQDAEQTTIRPVTEQDLKDDPHKGIYLHFKNLLRMWQGDLDQRPDDVKRSLAGQKETKTLQQVQDYIKPLLKLCKKRTLEDSMVHNLVKIILFSNQGEFVKAHDCYLDVAIGRAAWPIGVTMVGIHARTGRAKIESSNVAHVMNSELQRKYLTSIKRLLTYHQNKSDVDPSKKVH